jgi:hypothetical protein
MVAIHDMVGMLTSKYEAFNDSPKIPKSSQDIPNHQLRQLGVGMVWGLDDVTQRSK